MVSRVVLATTKWDDVLPDIGQRREQQLSETYWKEMLDKGSNMTRFLLTHESAWDIVDLILGVCPFLHLLDAFTNAPQHNDGPADSMRSLSITTTVSKESTT